MSSPRLPTSFPVTQSRSSSPTRTPAEVQKEGPSRTPSLRKMDDAGPKPISRSNSSGSAKVRSRATDGASKLAELQKVKTEGTTPVVDSGEGSSTLQLRSDLAKAQGAFHEELQKHEPGYLGVVKDHTDKGGEVDDLMTHAFKSAMPKPSSQDAATPQEASTSLAAHDAPTTPATPGATDAPQGFWSKVAKNDFKSTGAKIAASVANVTARNTLSVFLPTFARQFISMGIEAGFQAHGTSDYTKAMLGMGFGVLPAVTAHAYGAIRDELAYRKMSDQDKAGTDMWTSRRARMWMAGTAAAATIWEHKAGAAADNASLHIAFTLYTAMRDLLVQSNIRLDNKNTTGQSPDWKHFLTMSLAYGLDQSLVSLGMSTLASPSGPGAAVAHTPAMDQVKNAAIRAGLNLLGEIGEDLLFQSIPALRAKFGGTGTPHALQLGIHSEGPTRFLANGTLGPWAVRTGILATTIALTGVSGKGLPNFLKEQGYTEEDAKKLMEYIADFAIIGGVNGFLYEPFANSGANQPQPTARIEPADDIESRAGADDAVRDDAASVRTYSSVNVDMTNEAAVLRQSRDNLSLRQRAPAQDDA